MGFDLSMVRTPGYRDIPDHYPKVIRENAGYFRGVPYGALDQAEVLDHSIRCPKGPAWPPGGLTEERAEQLQDLFDPLNYDRESETVPSVEDLKPTFRELQIIQRYRDAADRVLSTISKKPGKVPSFKFGSNEGWRVTPEECLVIACRLGIYLEKMLAEEKSAADGRQQSMRLKLPGARAVKAPTRERLVEAIRVLDHKATDPFFILEDDSAPNNFMQAMKMSARFYLVEFSESNPQRQYRAQKVTARVAEELFAAYLRREASYKTAIGWEDVTEELFGDHYCELRFLQEFIAFNALAARYGGYEVR